MSADLKREGGKGRCTQAFAFATDFGPGHFGGAGPRAFYHRGPESFQQFFIGGREEAFRIRSIDGCFESALCSFQSRSTEVRGNKASREKRGKKTSSYEMTTPENFCPTESSLISPKCINRLPEHLFGSQCPRSQHAALKAGFEVLLVVSLLSLVFL